MLGHFSTEFTLNAYTYMTTASQRQDTKTIMGERSSAIYTSP